jgi:hypothetical protein
MFSFPKKGTYAEYYHNYVSYLENQDVLARLKDQMDELYIVVKKNKDKQDYRYAADKWTFKELLIHMSDTERIFSYRILCFSRAEKQAQPGFDQDEYINNFNFDHLNIKKVWKEFALLRKSNIQMIKNLTQEQIESIGVASGNPISCNALVYILAGHVDHHMKILKERYEIS